MIQKIGRGNPFTDTMNEFYRSVSQGNVAENEADNYLMSQLKWAYRETAKKGKIEHVKDQLNDFYAFATVQLTERNLNHAYLEDLTKGSRDPEAPYAELLRKWHTEFMQNLLIAYIGYIGMLYEAHDVVVVMAGERERFVRAFGEVDWKILLGEMTDDVIEAVSKMKGEKMKGEKENGKEEILN